MRQGQAFGLVERWVVGPQDQVTSGGCCRRRMGLPEHLLHRSPQRSTKPQRTMLPTEEALDRLLQMVE